MTFCYVIENRPRSSLALRRRGCRTDDVYEAKWVTLRRRPFDSPSDSSIASLNIASLLACYRLMKKRPGHSRPFGPAPGDETGLGAVTTGLTSRAVGVRL